MPTLSKGFQSPLPTETEKETNFSDLQSKSTMRKRVGDAQFGGISMSPRQTRWIRARPKHMGVLLPTSFLQLPGVSNSSMWSPRVGIMLRGLDKYKNARPDGVRQAVSKPLVGMVASLLRSLFNLLL